MSHVSIWMIGVGIFLIAELLTGTFYLLMLAIGMLAGLLAALLGASVSTQIILAALVGIGAVVYWHIKRSKEPQLDARSNPNVNPDIGQTVQVTHWEPYGKTKVHYRGSQWEAELNHAENHTQDNAMPSLGEYRIVEVRGIKLVLEKV